MAKSSYLLWFDAARGIAALCVLAGHCYQVFYSRSGGIELIRAVLGTAATYAVFVFFAMSGYLITLSIINNIRRNGRFVALDFAVSRIVRIYPPLVGAIAIVVLVGMVIQAMDLPQPGLPGREIYLFPSADIWTTLAMRGGFGNADGPLWSLFIEGQIYIIAGGTAMIGWSRRLPGALAGAVAIYIGVTMAKNEHFPLYAAIWLIGSALSFVPIRRAVIAPPAFLINSGAFSYSLYVIHFPLLLLAWSITQAIATVPNALAMIVCGLTTIPIAYGFAGVVERPQHFNKLMTSQLKVLRLWIRQERINMALARNRR